VIELESLARTTVDATAVVPSPDFVSNPLRDRPSPLPSVSLTLNRYSCSIKLQHVVTVLPPGITNSPDRGSTPHEGQTVDVGVGDSDLLPGRILRRGRENVVDDLTGGDLAGVELPESLLAALECLLLPRTALLPSRSTRRMTSRRASRSARRTRRSKLSESISTEAAYLEAPSIRVQICRGT